MASILNAQAAKYPKLKNQYDSLLKNFNGKLWHQLTLDLTNFVLEKQNWIDNNVITLFEDFIFVNKEKFNIVRLSQIAGVVSRQHLGSGTPTRKQVSSAIEMLQPLKEYIKSNSKKYEANPAYSLLESAEAELCLIRISPSELYDSDLAYSKIHSIELKCLPEIPIGDTLIIVKSALYRVQTEYYRALGPAHDFYTSAVKFIAFTPLESLAETERAQFARDICVSALISPDVFNFGEILDHVILDHLPKNESFLAKLLDVYHLGDLDSFSQIFSVNETAIKSIQPMWDNLEILRQKIGLMSFIQFVDREDGEKDFKFEEIAKHVKLESEQVEWLIMKSMAKGLIRGQIDGVKEVVHIDWVLPRVINSSQVENLQTKIKAWKGKVEETAAFVESGLIKA